ncbi:MAG: hypothetical protein ABH814_01525 [bacterium]
MSKQATPTVAKQLVKERIKAMSPNLTLHIGNSKKQEGYTRDELIKEIEKDSLVGKKIIAVELEFLQSLKTGFLDHE